MARKRRGLSKAHYGPLSVHRTSRNRTSAFLPAFPLLPLFKESCDPHIRRLEITFAAVETAEVKTSRTQPTCGYPGGSRTTTGIGRSVRFW
jgi:hypothetical protein